jgi:hypothetical protein
MAPDMCRKVSAVREPSGEPAVSVAAGRSTAGSGHRHPALRSGHACQEAVHAAGCDYRSPVPASRAAPRHPVRTRARAWPLVRVRSPAALRPSAISARIAPAAPSRPLDAPRARPDWAARAALTASSESDLPWAAAVLPVGAAGLHDPDAGRGDAAGQGGAVAAGALDPDQAHGPEPAQPAQQAAVAGRGGRELPDPRQPSDGVERSRDMHVRVGDPRRR